MTVEIKQLVIRAVVEPRSQDTAASAPPLQDWQRRREREAIIAACTREVLRRLKRLKDR